MLFSKLEIGKFFIFQTEEPCDVIHVFRKITDVQISSLNEGSSLSSTITGIPTVLEPDQEVSQLWI